MAKTKPPSGAPSTRTKPSPPLGHVVLSTAVPRDAADEVRARAALAGLSVDEWLRARVLGALLRTKPVVVRQDDAEDATVLEDLEAIRGPMTFRVLPSTDTPKATNDGHGH